jgi:hypothetical protein
VLSDVYVLGMTKFIALKVQVPFPTQRMTNESEKPQNVAFVQRHISLKRDKTTYRIIL